MSIRHEADGRLAEAGAAATTLRRAAASLRAAGSGLKAGAGALPVPLPTPGTEGALSQIERVIGQIQREADERAAEEAAVLDSPEGPPLRKGHAALDRALQAVMAGIESLRRAPKAGEAGSLDAPYGRSAPLGAHPGALCVDVADRTEALALTVEEVAILKANFARIGRPATAAP